MAGEPHPDFLLERLTAEQWAECLEFYSLEPFGFPVLDLMHGMQCAVTIAPHLKKGERADPRNYMVRPPDELEMTPEQTETMLDVLLGVRAS